MWWQLKHFSFIEYSDGLKADRASRSDAEMPYLLGSPAATIVEGKVHGSSVHGSGRKPAFDPMRNAAPMHCFSSDALLTVSEKFPQFP